MTALLVFLAALVLDQLVVSKLIPRGGEGQSQSQQNSVRVEEYLYSKGSYRCVIVGSSMSARFAPEYLPEDYYNLALMGEGALTGLELVRAHGVLPSCILVEVNDTLFRGVDEKLVAQAQSKWPGPSGLKIFRSAYQPVTLLGTFLKWRMGEKKDEGALPNRDQVLQESLKSEQERVDPEKMKVLVGNLLSQLQALERLGVRIFLFDPPRDTDLLRSPRNLSFQTALRETLGGAFSRIDFAQEGSFTTRDGIHLDAPSARRAAQFLVEASQAH